MREAVLELAQIRRPLQRSLDGQLWGFNGCHRWEAHEWLGRVTIRARIRRATPQVLRMHLI